MYNFVNSNLPLAFLFVRTAHVHMYSTIQVYNIRPYAPSLRSTQKPIIHIGPQVWNCIDNDIKCN